MVVKGGAAEMNEKIKEGEWSCWKERRGVLGQEPKRWIFNSDGGKA